jgi:hypothetical protein
MPGRPRLPPLLQQVEYLGRQHHLSVLAAFRPHNANDHLLTVDGTEIKFVMRHHNHQKGGGRIAPATVLPREEIWQ